jgi:hypothetical protein
LEHPIKVEADPAGQRGKSRDSLFLSATLRRLADGSERVVRVRNLSAGGMMADCRDLLVADEPVQVVLRNIGTVNGKIGWLSEAKVGVVFDTEIDPKAARKPIEPAESNVPDHIRNAGSRRSYR